MRYKRIAFTGTFMIASVVVLGVLLYHFNQDECPLGTFLCQNNTICIPQRGWCNGHIDCPEGDDEDVTNCFDSNENWEWFLKVRTQHPDPVCDPSHCPNRGCTCTKCLVTCEGFVEFPRDLSPNVTTITLTNNSLSRLTIGTLENYTHVRSLFLNSNNIQNLEKGIFLWQADLYWLVLSNNEIREIESGHFSGLLSLETLRVDNNRILSANFSDFENSSALELIDLSDNLLTHKKLIFPCLPALKYLILNRNEIEEISSELFSCLPFLKSLNMEENHLSFVNAKAFVNLQRLTELNLAYNRIIEVPLTLFEPLQNLKKLTIGFNPIENLQTCIFKPLKNLSSLGVEEIDMRNTEKDAFNQLTKLDFVYFKKFHYCTTYAPNVKKCRPASDGVSSLSHLLGKPILRASVWGISLVTCMGNALVLWGRFTAKDENRVLSIVIRNLAVSDILMGMYLLVIGLEDVRFRDNYKQEASMWMSSWSCTLLGMMAMISSEVSVLILSFMSIERFILIAAPLKSQKRALTPQTATYSMALIWITGIILALIPVIHWRRSTRFYGLNGMCFPLHIDDPFLVGWQYSAFIFLGLNLTGLVTIGYVYAGMFSSIWTTRHNTPLSMGDSEFAVRFFLIVLTDAFCWAPIIALKIMAFMKYPIAPDFHAWVVIFILPINSAINPLLYTFTTPKFRERLNEGWIGQIRNYAFRKTLTHDHPEMTGTFSEENKIMMLSPTTIANLEAKLSTLCNSTS